MPKILSVTGEELNAEYLLESFQGVQGLILESWGPSLRNPDYSAAMEILLSRLQQSGVSSISVNVISRDLVKALPNFDNRAIRLYGTASLPLSQGTARDIRIAIGAQQAQLKVDPNTKGGNRTKRVLLHSLLLDHSCWANLATGKLCADSFSKRLATPTANKAELDARVLELIACPVASPVGNVRPSITIVESKSYVRSPLGKAWVLQQAACHCELCDSDAPFFRDDGKPYLEVHHVTPLAESGSDTLSNAVGLCPNCHMRMHHGERKLELRREVVAKVGRLVHETGS